jgi:hypothetical protein
MERVLAAFATAIKEQPVKRDPTLTIVYLVIQTIDAFLRWWFPR